LISCHGMATSILYTKILNLRASLYVASKFEDT
jgi:hypothetical protein